MILKRLYIFFSLLIIMIVVFVNYRYLSPDESVISQLNYLKKQIRDNNADIEMQKVFPEGYVFMNALYGLTWCETALKNKNDSTLCKTAVREAIYALKKLESDEAQKIFDKNCSPAYGMFYQSWTNYLRGKILLTIGININPGLSNRYIRSCEILYSVVERRKSPFPETYKNASWPADAFPGIVSLKIHDKLFPEKYDTLIREWLDKVKERVDPETGLIPHSVNSITGQQTDVVRGSSLSLMIRLLTEIDTLYAKEQYLSYRKLFADEAVGLTIIREYQQGYDKSGDIDSGPVVLNAGSAATIVGIGTSRACGDYRLAEALSCTIEAAGFPVEISGEKRYLMGTLPVADMFIAWSKTTPVYCRIQNRYEYVGNAFVMLSGLVLLVIIITIVLSVRGSKRRKIR